MLPLDDRVTGEGVLDEGGSLPDLAPTPAGIQNDATGQSVRRRQIPVEAHRTVEVGASIDAIPFQGHIVGAQVAEFEHPGFHTQGAGLLDGDPVGNDEIPVHEDVADAAFLQQLAQERSPALHVAVVRHPHLGGKAEFPQRKRHLGDRNAAAPQVVAEAGEEQTNRTHQQQHRAVNAHLHQGWSPSPAQIPGQHSKNPGTPSDAAAAPSGGTGPAPASGAVAGHRARPAAHRRPAPAR